MTRSSAPSNTACWFCSASPRKTPTPTGRWLADKIVGLRIFQRRCGQDEPQPADVGGACWWSASSPCYGDAKGRRPSFIGAAAPEIAIPLYEAFINASRPGRSVATGRFGADMQVELVNDGPVTLILDTKVT